MTTAFDDPLAPGGPWGYEDTLKALAVRRRRTVHAAGGDLAGVCYSSGPAIVTMITSARGMLVRTATIAAA